jgi:hypothetical protein
MNKLYELTGALAQVWDKLNDDDADLDTIEGTLQCIEGAIEVKAEGMARLVKMLDYDADIIATEIKRLTERKRARENRISRIKSYLQEQMELMGKDKITTPTLTISLQNNPPSVDDFAPSLVPAKYQRVTYSIDKSAILADLKAGIEVPGTILKQGRSIRFR